MYVGGGGEEGVMDREKSVIIWLEMKSFQGLFVLGAILVSPKSNYKNIFRLDSLKFELLPKIVSNDVIFWNSY